MLAKSDVTVFIKRLGVSFLVALVLVVAISEVAFYFQKDRVSRPPQTVELVVPHGTAAQVAAGNPVPSIPEEIDFLIGDVLLVLNNDSVDHQLGPVWVPPGTSASLTLERAENFAYACSFKPSRYLGINVRQPTTLKTRLTALGLAVPPTTMVFLLYGFLVFPPGNRPGKRPKKIPMENWVEETPILDDGQG